MKNKHGFLIRDYVIAGILFGAVIALFILAIGDIANNYGNTNIIDKSYSSKYNQFYSTIDTVNTMRSSTAGSHGLTLLGAFDVAFASTFIVIQLVFSSLTTFGSMMASFITDYTFINGQVLMILIATALACISVYLTFVWLSSISRGRI